MSFYCMYVFYLKYRLDFDNQRDLLQRDLDRALGHDYFNKSKCQVLNALGCWLTAVQVSAVCSGSPESKACPGLCQML